MRLPVIKKLNEFIETRDEDFIWETLETLEMLTTVPTIKDEELDVIGELISNMYGALEVRKEIEAGVPAKAAYNGFMQRVMGSIDRT